MFGDFLEGFVVGVRQAKVKVHEATETGGAEQQERIVETDPSPEVQVELCHQKAHEKVHAGTDAAAQVFTPASAPEKNEKKKKNTYG